MFLSPRSVRARSKLQRPGGGKKHEKILQTTRPCFGVTELGTACPCPDFVLRTKGDQTSCRSCGHLLIMHMEDDRESSLDPIPEEDDSNEGPAPAAGPAPTAGSVLGTQRSNILSLSTPPLAPGPSTSQLPQAEPETVQDVLARVRAAGSSMVSDAQAHQEASRGFRPNPAGSSVGPVRRTRSGHRSAAASQAASATASKGRRVVSKAPAERLTDVGAITLLPYGMSETPDSTLDVPNFVMNNPAYPDPIETERLRAAGLVSRSVQVNPAWNSTECNDFLRRLFPRQFEFMDALNGWDDPSSFRGSHVALCMRNRGKLIPMHGDGITGGDLVRAKSGRGQANSVSYIHLVTRVAIEPAIYKNLSLAIAHIHDNTYAQYLAEVTGDGGNTPTTLMDSDQEPSFTDVVNNGFDVEEPPAGDQPRNKGKAKAKASSYSLSSRCSPLFDPSSSDDEDSADDFFTKPSASVKTSAPARHSQRLANKVSSSIFDRDTARGIDTSLSLTSKTASKTGASMAPVTTPPAATSSKKRIRSPSPPPSAQPSKRMRRLSPARLDGTGTSEEPIVIASDDEWFPLFMANSTASSLTSSSISRKPEGLPTPSKVKNDPWATLNNVDPSKN